MKFEYEVKGIKLDRSDMREINQYYEAACTAEYLLDNFDNITEENALSVGQEVRRRMDKYDYSENEAIDEVLEEMWLEENEVTE